MAICIYMSESNSACLTFPLWLGWAAKRETIKQRYSETLLKQISLSEFMFILWSLTCSMLTVNCTKNILRISLFLSMIWKYIIFRKLNLFSFMLTFSSFSCCLQGSPQQIIWVHLTISLASSSPSCKLSLSVLLLSFCQKSLVSIGSTLPGLSSSPLLCAVHCLG